MSNKTKNKVVMISAARLELLLKNPRKITGRNLTELASLIERDPEFFYQRPCLVNHITETDRYVIYAGSQRYKAATEKLGWEEIPCIVEQDVDAELMDQRMLLDNHHKGEWDHEKLQAHFTQSTIDSIGMEFKLPTDFEKKVASMTTEQAEFPIVPRVDEKYDVFVIVTNSEVDSIFMQTFLDLKKSQSYKQSTKIGQTRVITFEQFQKAMGKNRPTIDQDEPEILTEDD